MEDHFSREEGDIVCSIGVGSSEFWRLFSAIASFENVCCKCSLCGLYLAQAVRLDGVELAFLHQTHISQHDSPIKLEVT